MKSTLAVFCTLALATCAAAVTAFADYGPCHPTGSSASKVTRFQETFVCITFNGVQRAIFNPKADDYSLLNIAGSAKALPTGSGVVAKGTGYTEQANCTQPTNLTDFYVTVEVSSLTTNQVVPYVYQKRSCSGSATFYPFLTAVIIVDEGKVTGITYDNACAFCDGESGCQDNGFNNATKQVLSDPAFRACGVPASECQGGKACDLKVYVVWVGTDSNGEYFTSGNLRFSRFRQFAVGSLFDEAQKEVTAGTNTVTQAASEADKIPGEVLG